GRVARDEAAHVARQHAGVDVVAAAGRIADIDLDGAALVEIGHAVGAGGREARKREQQGTDARRQADHGFLRGSAALLFVAATLGPNGSLVKTRNVAAVERETP